MLFFILFKKYSKHFLQLKSLQKASDNLLKKHSLGGCGDLVGGCRGGFFKMPLILFKKWV
ncbi:hypothetical protein ECC12_02355 [Helicobacter pylori]|uniref:Uncharacterized protein n=1 Tax=Helicobacter pylori TaxID=210 RepID=A0A438PW73_HELPX|nr:hypothetical protein ECC12_02355 [Helicobacter pylori]